MLQHVLISESTILLTLSETNKTGRSTATALLMAQGTCGLSRGEESAAPPRFPLDLLTSNTFSFKFF